MKSSYIFHRRCRASSSVIRWVKKQCAHPVELKHRMAFAQDNRKANRKKCEQNNERKKRWTINLMKNQIKRIIRLTEIECYKNAWILLVFRECRWFSSIFCSHTYSPHVLCIFSSVLSIYTQKKIVKWISLNCAGIFLFVI